MESFGEWLSHGPAAAHLTLMLGGMGLSMLGAVVLLRIVEFIS